MKNSNKTIAAFTPLGLMLTLLTAIAFIMIFSFITSAQNSFPSKGSTEQEQQHVKIPAVNHDTPERQGFKK